MADLYASNWTEDDNSNSSASPDGLPEGCAPSGVNNWARANAGAIKRYVNQQIPKTTAGTSTAYTLSYTVAPGALVDGMSHLVEFDQANGASATLNINSLGAIPLHYYAAGAWRLAPPAFVGANDIRRIVYHSSSGAYRILGHDVTGELRPFAGATAPAGTLLCFGQAVSRTAYVGLFTALGTTYGVGDGSTTFNLPDMRGQTAGGKSNMGGVDAGNLTGGATLGAALGAQTHTHTVSASGNGTTSGPGSTTPVRNDATNVNVGTQDHTHAFSVNVTGTAAAGSSVQPTRVLNYLIRI